MISDNTAKRLAKAQERMADSFQKEYGTIKMEPQIISLNRRCQEVWIRAWVAVAAIPECEDATIPGVWADQCVKEFKERFKDDQE